MKGDSSMNELQIFNNFTELKEHGTFELKHYFGYVYFLEYGEYIKIGCTKNPVKRLGRLYSNAKSYHDLVLGRIFVTTAHTNYTENEAILHKYFDKERKKNSELFNLTLEEVIEAVFKIPLVFLDESEEKEKREIEFFEMVKKYMLQTDSEKLLIKRNDFGCILAIILDLLSEIVELREEISNLTDTALNFVNSEEIEVPDEIFNSIMILGNETTTLNEKELQKIHELFGV